MIEEFEIKQIQECITEFLGKMTTAVSYINMTVESGPLKDVVHIDIIVGEPQILIGQNGQTLIEISRILKVILNKKLQKDFYLDLDINEYKKKKNEYLEALGMELADKVLKTGENQVLPPMPAHERRVVHNLLSGRRDIVSESRGEGAGRHIVISPAI